MLFLLRDESGQGLAEYGLILSLVVIVVVAIVAVMGPMVGNMFSRITNAIR